MTCALCLVSFNVTTNHIRVGEWVECVWIKVGVRVSWRFYFF